MTFRAAQGPASKYAHLLNMSPNLGRVAGPRLVEKVYGTSLLNPLS